MFKAALTIRGGGILRHQVLDSCFLHIGRDGKKGTFQSCKNISPNLLYEMTGISKFIDAIVTLLITTYDLQPAAF